jgi:hypothetical protein
MLRLRAADWPCRSGGAGALSLQVRMPVPQAPRPPLQRPMRGSIRQAPNQLRAAGAPPAPVYLIFGDEPLQLGEAADAMRAAARAHGYDERTCLEADAQFDWSELANAAASLSLFAERRLIEVRVAGEGVGRDGGEAIRRTAPRRPTTWWCC